MTKTPAVAYYERKIQTTSKTQIYAELDDAPLSIRDYAFLSDIVEGLSNHELATKYKKSPSRISQWKRSIFERMHRYDLYQQRNNEKQYTTYDF